MNGIRITQLTVCYCTKQFKADTHYPYARAGSYGCHICARTSDPDVQSVLTASARGFMTAVRGNPYVRPVERTLTIPEAPFALFIT